MSQLRSIESTPRHIEESYDDFESRLVRTLGATVGGGALTRALGYPTQEAFRKAYQRGRLPIKTFELEGRRGRFAATLDIAAWLWNRKQGLVGEPTELRGAT